jgi:hypothetical protein
MSFFKNPAWLTKYVYPYATVDDIPEEVYATINQKLHKLVDFENQR